MLKLVAGIGEPLVGRLLLYDGLAQRFEEIRYKRREVSRPPSPHQATGPFQSG